MGIVIRQSASNMVVTYFGFAIGAVNTMFLYTTFLTKENYGIVNFLLSAANVLMPIMAFGVHNSLIRFFALCKTETERERFMSFMLWLPILLIVPICILGYIFFDQCTALLLERNPKTGPYLWLIPVTAVFMAYFEIFYAWVKVHMKSVFGNFISEVLVRAVVTVLLFSIHLGWLRQEDFFFWLTGAYGLQFVGMMAYALKVRRPKFSFQLPENAREILAYSSVVIISGSVATLLLDFDKVMIPFYKVAEENAVYALAIFIATVIAVPSRAMLQILHPITAKLMGEKNFDELSQLYQKSAMTLQVLGGLIMLGIFLNINEMYRLIPGKYDAGTTIVFIIGISKFYEVILGNNNSILLNTRYYRLALFFGIMTVVMMIGLNMLLIPPYGILGSAWATLITVIVYNSVKLYFVVREIGLFPFTGNTLKSLGIIGITFLLFYYWHFPFSPIPNIILKSILITAVYVGAHYKLAVSPEINQLIDQVLVKVRRR